MGEKNLERTRYPRYRTTARGFLRNHATLDALIEMNKLITERRIKLNEDAGK